MCAATFNLYGADHARVQNLVTAKPARGHGHALRLMGELQELLQRGGVGQCVVMLEPVSIHGAGAGWAVKVLMYACVCVACIEYLNAVCLLAEYQLLTACSGPAAHSNITVLAEAGCCANACRASPPRMSGPCSASSKSGW